MSESTQATLAPGEAAAGRNAQSRSALFAGVDMPVFLISVAYWCCLQRWRSTISKWYPGW